MMGWSLGMGGMVGGVINGDILFIVLLFSFFLIEF